MSAIFKIWNTYISPATASGLDLGSDSLPFANLYLSGVGYLGSLEMSGNIELSDYSVKSISYLFGASDDDYIKMGESGRILFVATGGGTPFSSPDHSQAIAQRV